MSSAIFFASVLLLVVIIIGVRLNIASHDTVIASRQAELDIKEGKRKRIRWYWRDDASDAYLEKYQTEFTPSDNNLPYVP